MSYPPRQFHEGYWYHVYSRGQRKEPLFFSPDDREYFLEQLDEVFSLKDTKLGSFCLMTNHYHLLVKMGSIPLDRVFQSFHTRYAKFFNEKRDVDGHVFQSRPKMKIVLSDDYLLQLVAYIHENPVEAGITETPDEYEWSSDPFFRKSGSSNPPFDCWKYPPHFQNKNCPKIYREAIHQEDHEYPKGDVYVGTEEEYEELERRKEGREGHKRRERRGRLEEREIAQKVADKTGIPVSRMKQRGRKRNVSRARQKAMALMYREGYGPKEIGQFFGRSKSAALHAWRKYKDELDEEH